MKIRNGFVSNSSSSMFVVAFPREPKSVKDVHEMMFNGNQFLDNPYDEDKTETKMIAQTVWEDIKPQKRWSHKTALSRIGDALRSSNGGPRYDDFKTIPPHIKELEYDGKIIIIARIRERTDWKAYNKACDEHVRIITNEVLKEFEDKKIYVFRYGDEDGAYFSVLEHGGIFSNLAYKHISCH